MLHARCSMRCTSMFAHTIKEAAFAAAALLDATRVFGAGIGDRSCMALAVVEKLPALTTDKEWTRVEVAGLKVILAR